MIIFNFTSKEQIPLTNEQQHLFDLVINQKQNIFITGKAGTGKSYLLQEIIKAAKEKYQLDKVLVCAPNALAAENVGGVTFHGIFGIKRIFDEPLGTNQSRYAQIIRKYFGGQQIDQDMIVYQRLKNAEILIIDEISQLSSELFELCDYRLQQIRKSKEYFGGCQVVLCGDFMQLPPPQEQEQYLFETEQFKEGIKNQWQLEENHRQQGDKKFQTILDQVRENKLTWESIVELKQREIDSLELQALQNQQIQQYEQKYNQNQIEKINLLYQDIYQIQKYPLQLDTICTKLYMYKKLYVEFKKQSFKQKLLPIRLYSKNIDVQKYNNIMLRKMHQQLYTFIQKSEDGKLKKQNITLCKNAQVMITENIDQINGIVNGTIGTVIEINIPQYSLQHLTYDTSNKYWKYQLKYDQKQQYQPQIILELKNGKQYVMQPKQAEKRQLIYFPLTLAYAITIHKSQGQSFDEVIADIGDCFEYGQAYVALSRAKSLNGLTILNFDLSKIMANDACKAQLYNALKYSKIQK